MVNDWVTVAFLSGVALDALLGDPMWLPHPVVGFGHLISSLEHRYNHGSESHRRRAGGCVALGLIIGIFLIASFIMGLTYRFVPVLFYFLTAICVFYCLACTTLMKEVVNVFKAADRSLEEGRVQVARIVGRDTNSLSDREIRTAALETLAENLSDGVIAPLFWFALLGVPGMLAYKMVNTLDSMIGYKNDRYKDFGRFAALTDDFFNYIPARLTAYGMILVSGRWRLFSFVRRYGRCHASPNSGYPEAALAGILNCRFGGPHDYFGKEVWKPYIGYNERDLNKNDLFISLHVCRLTTILYICICTVVLMLL